MQKIAFFLSLLLSLIYSNTVFAKVYAPSAVEVEFSYQTTFRAKDFDTAADDLAAFHVSHLFGLMSMPENVAHFGLDHETVGGLGAPRWPLKMRIISDKIQTQGKRTRVREIKYSVQGKMLLHKQAAQKILRAGVVEFVMPAQLYDIYDKNCTDADYYDETDYWYYYDIYREGCEYLQEEPYGKVVDLQVKEIVTPWSDLDPRFDLLRGNNGNGHVFEIYIVHGFYEDPRDQRDIARRDFRGLRKYFRDAGFYEEVLNDQLSKQHSVYQKWQDLSDGRRVQVRVHHMLVDTELNSRSLTFARFFKDAVENADVFAYLGHSGLGSVLDIEGIKSKVGNFEFNHDKRQIFYFDACSSYSYFLSSFLDQKTTAKIDIMTYGLSSYFEMTLPITTSFLDALLAEEDTTSWGDILQAMEQPLGGGSYLLNVGGL